MKCDWAVWFFTFKTSFHRPWEDRPVSLASVLRWKPDYSVSLHVFGNAGAKWGWGAFRSGLRTGTCSCAECWASGISGLKVLMTTLRQYIIKWADKGRKYRFCIPWSTWQFANKASLFSATLNTEYLIHCVLCITLISNWTSISSTWASERTKAEVWEQLSVRKMC